MGSKSKKKDERRGEVLRVEAVTDQLRRIRFSWSGARAERFSPGDKIKVYVEGKKRRSYTPSRVNTKKGWAEIIVHLHGEGPGSKWASKVRPGDSFELDGPGSSFKPRWTKKGRGRVFFFGDATTLGLAAALVDGAPKGYVIGGALELSAVNAGAVSALGLPLEVCKRSAKGGKLIAYAKSLELDPREDTIWLSGESTSVKALRSLFLKRGFEKKQLRVKSYWKDRKRK